MYINFKQQITIPRNIIDRLYESKYASHFYSDTEIKSFRKKWQKTN